MRQIGVSFFLRSMIVSCIDHVLLRLGIDVIPTGSGKIEQFVLYVGRWALSTLSIRLSLSEGHCRRN